MDKTTSLETDDLGSSKKTEKITAKPQIVRSRKFRIPLKH